MVSNKDHINKTSLVMVMIYGDCWPNCVIGIHLQIESVGQPIRRHLKGGDMPIENGIFDFMIDSTTSKKK